MQNFIKPEFSNFRQCHVLIPYLLVKYSITSPHCFHISLLHFLTKILRGIHQIPCLITFLLHSKVLSWNYLPTIHFIYFVCFFLVVRYLYYFSHFVCFIYASFVRHKLFLSKGQFIILFNVFLLLLLP